MCGFRSNTILTFLDKGFVGRLQKRTCVTFVLDTFLYTVGKVAAMHGLGIARFIIVRFSVSLK
jgi:hypothetical protein